MFCPKCGAPLKREEEKSTNIIHYICTDTVLCGKKWKEDQSGPVGSARTNLQEE